MTASKPSITHTGRTTRRLALPITSLFLLILFLAAGCATEEPETLTTATSEPDPEIIHSRLEIDFYRGINEPRSADWDYLPVDAERLLRNGINTVALEPPVLISDRAGGQPRVILDGAAIVIPGLIDNVHEKGLAVFLSPTTASPGFQEELTVGDTTLERLTEDSLSWAETAEDRQVELFAPLSRCNIVLDTSTCNTWQQGILPAVRERFSGPVAAKVVADIEQAPVAGGLHDFELLNYRGYDFIMLDIHPWGRIYNEKRFRLYVTDVLDKAEAVAERDDLKGIIIGDLRLPRNVDEEVQLGEGTWINEEEQAEITGLVMELAMPRISGFFFYGWSLAGYGVRDHQAEDTIIEHFNRSAQADENTGTSTTVDEDTIIENG